VTSGIPPQPAPERPEPSRTERRTHSRTVVVTFLGAIVRRLDSWMPIAAAIDLMSPLGLDGPSVRTAISRLKKRGWLEPEMRAGVRGYALTASALSALTAGDEVIWHMRQPAELTDGWCIVHFSVPESARRERHQLRAHLAAIGFGNVGTALWIAPSRMRPAGERAIAELGLTNYSAVFVGDHVSGQQLEKLVYQSWDLAEIDRSYCDFTAAYEGLAALLAATPDGLAPREAFVTYVEVVDRWRRLPFRDPGLPRELLADDWHGPAAAAVFEEIVLSLEPRALDYAAGLWPQRQSA
jgi:phenylacetic acid degradation operon negative regulatory protein